MARGWNLAGCLTLIGASCGGVWGQTLAPPGETPIQNAARDPARQEQLPAVGAIDPFAQEKPVDSKPSTLSDKTASPGESFPYRAVVEVEQAVVRSGPGDEYYETLTLGRGDTVEVYRHDPGGWYAIRPPEASFSLVPAEFLKLVDEDIAETTVAGLKSLIGSETRDELDRGQITLRLGERVVLLEAKPAQGLCKIAPPAGEFRWIHMKSLTRGEGTHTTASEEPSQPDAWRSAPQTTAFAPREKPREAGIGGGRSEAAAKPAARPARSLRPVRGWVPPSGAEPDDGEFAVPPMEGTLASTSTATRIQDEIDDRTPPHTGGPLDDIDLDLSKMVCRPKSQWELEPLRQRTQAVLRGANDGAEQNRARRMLDRLTDFERVRRRALGLAPLADDDLARHPLAAAEQPGNTRPTAERRFASGGRQASEADPPVPSPRESDLRKPSADAESDSPLPPNWDDPRFDGVGRLVPLEKRADGDPPFLLVDDQGVTRYFVTPAPGVNLRAFREQIIGVSGTRVDDPLRGKPHLTAQRVTMLQKLRQK